MVQTEKSRLRSGVVLLLLALQAGMTSCFKAENVEKMVTYNGPAIEVDNVKTIYSDSAIQRIILTAPKQIEQQNGDRLFPKGLKVDFFNEEGKNSATLTANTGYYYKEPNNYVVRGNVIVKNVEEHKQLNTEELNWDPETGKVTTTKFVRIVSPEQILTGEGLDADQNFTHYKIRKPIGSFDVGEEEEEEDEE